MPALNIFRLFPNQKTALIAQLQKSGLSLIGTAQANAGRIAYDLNLYFSTSPKRSFVKWIENLREVFDVPEKRILNYSAVMTIESKSLFYAISYGTAHFHIARHADLDFGINVASRMLAKYIIKTSRSFGGKTTKSIITYDMISELPFDGGESVNYIKGIPASTADWGKSVSCGHSVLLRKRDFSPKCAHIIAQKLEALLTSGKIRTNIPRSLRVVAQSTLDKLNSSLIRDMKKGHYLVAVSPQQMSGVDFIFSDRLTYFIDLGSSEIEVDPHLSLVELRAIVDEHFNSDYSMLLTAAVEAREGNQRVFSKPFLCFIDYVDAKGRYYLDDGIWYQFDSNYLNYLRSAVTLIPLSTSPEIPILRDADYKKWIKAGKRDPAVHYREKYLNELLARAYGYENYDRAQFKYDQLTYEVADLVKGDSLTFVKIGKTQKLNYVVDQSLNALNVLKRARFRLPVNGRSRRIKNIALWLFLDRKGTISGLDDLNSLIFLMKLADWRKEVLMAGLTPLVKISYFR